MSLNHFLELTNHIVFPYKLPNESNKNPLEETQCLKFASEIIIEYFEDKNLFSQANLFKKWINLQSDSISIDPIKLNNELVKLNQNESLAVYIYHHNVCLLITMHEKEAIMSYFQTSIDNKQIMSTTSDVKVDLPFQSIHIHCLNTLKSEQFSNLIADLTSENVFETLSISKKAGSDPKETRDISKTDLISNWLFPLLISNDSPKNENNFPIKVSKKFRDEINFVSNYPFRRSGMWMAIKSILEINLCNMYPNNNKGLIYYKTLIILILEKLCRESIQFTNNDLDELKDQMIKKLARKIYKLIQLAEIPKDILIKCNKTIQTIRNSIEENHKTLLSLYNFNIDLDYNKINLKDKIHLKSAQLKNNLLEEDKLIKRSDQNQYSKSLFTIERNRFECDFPKISFLDHSINAELFGIHLYEIENWLLSNTLNHDNYDKIYALYIKYIFKAKNYYVNDQIGYSRMVIVCLKLICFLDEIACLKYPLLLDHNMGINYNLIEYLLVAKFEDLTIVYSEIIEYISRRNSNAIYQSLIDSRIDRNAFSVRFFYQDTFMQNLKEKIVYQAEKNKQSKIDQYNKMNKEYRDLDDEATRLDCTCYNRHKYRPYCKYCQLKLKMRNMELDVFEWPLPNNEVEANSIIFELNIPSEISQLRDALYLFKSQILNRVEFLKNKCHKIWLEYDILKNFSSHNPKFISLGSKTKSFYNSHYKKVHISASVDEFLQNNGLTIDLVNLESKSLIKIDDYFNDYLQKKTTFKLVNPYNYLQYAINSTLHSENQILADLNHLPTDLTVKEHIKFGFMRSGHQLQMINLLDCLETRVLSLNDESVTSLISQVLWQIGPIDYDYEKDYKTPSSHFILFSNHFISILNDIIKSYLDQIKNKWNDYLMLYNLINISLRCFSINKSDNFVILLIKSRHVASKWLNDLNNLIKLELDEKIRFKYFKQSVYISCFLLLTYDTDKNQVEKILFESSHVEAWLEAMKIITTYKSLNDDYENNHFLINLFRRIDICSLNIINQYIKVIKESNECLSNFTKSHTNIVNIDSIWELYSPFTYPIWHSNKIDNELISISLNGEILRNYVSIGLLPKSLTNDPIYKSFFRSLNFESSFDNLKKTYFSDKIHVENNQYIVFEFIYDSNYKLIVKEYFKQVKSIFIESSRLKGYFPQLLIENYSHWYNLTLNQIEFRSKYYSDEYLKLRCSIWNQIDYVLNLNNFILIDKLKREYIDYQSDTFNEITNKFASRLDQREYVHIFKGDSDVELVIYFPRLDLNFKLNMKDECIWSVEFLNFKVLKNQTINTLIGLENYILLCENEEYPIQKLIIPHGKVVSKIDLSHPNKRIIQIFHDLNVKNEVYFVYQLDFDLKRLKADDSNTAWLYLALLHAITSTLVEDDFLNMTGTEMALYLLQSAICWSNKPLSNDSFRILNQISMLSPKREYYPSHLEVMQKVNWPISVPAYCSHEGFQFIAEKLLNDSLVVKTAFKYQGEYELIKTSSLKLAQKAYFKAAKLFRPSELINLLDWKENKRKEFIEFKTIISNDIIDNIRLIQLDAYKPSSCDLKFLTINQLEWKKASELSLINKNVFCWFKGYLNSNDSHEMIFKNNWLELYKLTQLSRKSKEDEIRLKFILGYFAYKGINLDDLTIFRNLPKCRDFDCYENNYNFDVGFCFDQYKIIAILESFYKLNYNNLQSKDERDFFRKKSSDIKLVSSHLATYSKDLKYVENFYSRWIYKFYNIDSRANNQIESLFKTWKQNKMLNLFLNELESAIKISIKNNPSVFKLNDLIREPTILNKKSINLKYELVKNKNDEKIYSDAKLLFNSGQLESKYLEIKIESREIRNVEEFPLKLDINEENNLSQKYFNDLKESWASFYNEKGKKPSIESKLESYLKESIRIYSNTLKGYENELKKFYSGSCDTTECLVKSGLWPPFSPILFLRNLLNISTDSDEVDSLFKNMIGALAVLMSLQQRAIRCLKYFYKMETHEHLLEQELINVPFSNWSPTEKPEWLILQLELNIMIRDIQVTVANQMLDSSKNKVIQLNMGEGKTAVIAPLLIASLAKQDYLIRLIVLKSLIEINYTALTYKMGFILNKRVYHLPFSRETNQQDIKIYDNLLKECYNNKHLLITLPEYCLSFKLKSQETLDPQIKQLQNWIETNSKDILDESDEILTTKYQLVYSIGNQSSLDGEKIRWQVARDVLKLAKKNLKLFSNDINNNFEYKIDLDNPQKFPVIRLYNSNNFEELRQKICIDFLNRKDIETSFHELNSEEKRIFKSFVLDHEINNQQITMLKKQTNKNFENIVFILRGLLTYDILLHVLQKRWRVDYGVNTKSNRLLQAVPFRAKDVPAERAQYGHPEIFILLTYLSYYYSGLDNHHLDTLFSMLENSPYGSSIYTKWIETLPSDLKIDSSIRNFESINLIDSKQKDQIIYPILKYHTVVIDYWLDTILFPKEAKEFDQRLSASAWDLANANQNRTVGFSGTNDSRFLLPLSIQFEHIPELIGTTGSVLASIVNLESDCYIKLNMDSNESNLLEILKSNNIKVLIDVGAFMLKYTNEQVIDEWLEIEADSEAAVYFNDNKLMVKIKSSNKTQSFETSSYKQNLSKCLIYLDEFHTRGTDLKIPKNHLAGVTLSKGLTKDRLFQACMRMRLLGKGHSCKFIASFETNKLITNNSYSKPQLNILKWSIDNSINQINNEMIYWAYQGVSYVKKQTTKNFKEDYTNDLKCLYSNNRSELLIHEIIKRKIHHLKLDVHSFESIFDKLQTLGSHLKKYDLTLEEEIEKEIEIECEVEIETEKPAAKPYKNVLHKDVENFVKYKIFNKESSSFVSLMSTLNNSSIKKLAENDSWSSEILASQNYVNTVESSLFDDCFFRPPRWIAVDISKKIFLILSAFEANELFRYFDGTIILLLIIPRNRKNQLRMISFPENYSLDDLELKWSLEQLFIYSGSLYFNKLEEQDIFLQFIAYCLKRSELELKYLDDGLINKNGYVEINNRSIVFNYDRVSKFEKDPNEFIIKLINIRNYSMVPELAHHLEIFLKGKIPLSE